MARTFASFTGPFVSLKTSDALALHSVMHIGCGAIASMVIFAVVTAARAAATVASAVEDPAADIDVATFHPTPFAALVRRRLM